MKDDLIELQTQMSFQEDTVAQLNDVVTQQQKDIERLTADLEQLKKQFQSLVSTQLEEQEESAPPHY
ncbi:MAG: SlyX family protein [Endozoicomonas sp.]